MKIKKIKKLSSNKYKIDFEDAESIITYDNVILENNILLKKEIDSDLYIKIGHHNRYYEIYNKAVKYIMTKLRSEKEIIEYLRKHTEKTEIIDKVIMQLKRENLINDERYIEAFIEDKINLTTWGPYKIKRELEKMDMNEEYVIKTLEKYDLHLFEDKVQKIISKKEKANKKDSLYVIKKKIERDLLELGYPIEMIKENLSSISVDEVSVINKEMDKLYKKLSKKYMGQELYYQLKQKMLQKGFNLESINEVLEIYKDI